MMGIVGFLAFSMFAIAGAFDGEMAMPATPELIRSSTIRTSPASSALDAGPVYTHLYSDFGFSLFHCSHPLPRTVKNGLSSPLTTTAKVFFWAWARAVPPKPSTSTAAPASQSVVFLIPPLHGIQDSGLYPRRRPTTGRPYLSPTARTRGRNPSRHRLAGGRKPSRLTPGSARHSVDEPIAQSIASRLFDDHMPTIREVAGRARVSPTTVSHVVNATRFVSHEIRTRVLEAMAELGYHPNAVARSLRRGRTHTLGLILPDSTNPYFAELGRSIEAAAFGRDHSVVLCNTEGEELRERVYVDLLTRRQVDGLLYVPAGSRVDVLRDLLRRSLPVVMVDRDLPEAPVDVVLSDKRGGAYLATRHLISLGHRRIACIGGPQSLLMSGRRLQGYRDALTEADLPIDEGLVLRGDYRPQSGWAAARSLLAMPAPPTAIFAAN